VKTKLSIIGSYIIFLLTSPWFSGIGSEILFGFPGWVVVSFFVTLVYAVVVGLLLQFNWHTPDDGEL
jgi:ABC-type sulfate transport system permease subunit